MEESDAPSIHDKQVADRINTLRGKLAGHSAASSRIEREVRIAYFAFLVIYLAMTLCPAFVPSQTDDVLDWPASLTAGSGPAVVGKE